MTDYGNINAVGHLRATIFANAAAEAAFDAAAPPPNGAIAYRTDIDGLRYRVGGAWVDRRLSPTYVTGLQAEPDTANPTTELQVQPGFAKDETETTDLIVTAPLNVDITASGIGGLDPADALTPNTWYALWLYGATNRSIAPDLLLSDSFSAPSAIGGFDTKRYIGECRTDGASAILPFRVVRDWRQRRVLWDQDSFFTREALVGGTSAVPAAVSLAARVPPTSTYAYIGSQLFCNGAANGVVYYRATGDPNIFAIRTGQGAAGVGAEGTHNFWLRTDANQSIDYQMAAPAGSDVAIYMNGYLRTL